MSNIIAKEYQGFEQIKQIDKDGNEFWYARELAPVLEYTEWRNFTKVIDRAMLACQNSGIQVFNQFVELDKLIEHGKGGKRKIVDYKLSRYACYLIVQNSDPRKEVIAKWQSDIVLNTIKRVGGILPEEQPTLQKSIEEVQREQLKKLKAQKTLMLDE